MADLSTLTIHEQTYNIKDALARENIVYINRDFNNTKINGIPIRNQNLTRFWTENNLVAITNDEIDALFTSS